jgi:aspyridone synthetase trans-acting enoyl reductase
LSLVLDCIGTAQSAILCYAAIGRAGGRYVALEKFPDALTSTRRVVRASWAMGPIMFGRKIVMGEYSFEADPEARQFAGHWYALVESLLFAGRLKSHPVRIIGNRPDWTEAVLRGLDVIRERSISGEKLVVEVI